VPRFTEEDDALLDELGVEVETRNQASRTPREERLIAGLEEIQRFVEEHGHPPQHGEGRDIFERLYAVRLDRLRELDDCRVSLNPSIIKGSWRVRSLPRSSPRTNSTMTSFWRSSGLTALLRPTSPNSGMFAPLPRSGRPRKSPIARNARISTASSRYLSRCSRSSMPVCARPGGLSASPRSRRAGSTSWAARKPMSRRRRSRSPTSTAT